ncbi:MAG: response regulator [Clostridia bacterium]|nr:response regulator [Clostridia bacterium]
MDGITVAKRIRQKDEVVQFIYVSSYDTYCKEILEVEPFRFLDKPIDTDKFEEIFMKVCERITDVNRCFVCQFGGANYRIPYKDIMYFQSEKREIHVYTKEAKVRYYGKMNEVQAQVDRVSRFLSL